MTTITEPALVDTRAVARVLGYTGRHITELAIAGKLPALRFAGGWRFDPIEVARAVAGESPTAERIAEAIRREASARPARAGLRAAVPAR